MMQVYTMKCVNPFQSASNFWMAAASAFAVEQKEKGAVVAVLIIIYALLPIICRKETLLTLDNCIIEYALETLISMLGSIVAPYKREPCVLSI